MLPLPFACFCLRSCTFILFFFVSFSAPLHIASSMLCVHEKDTHPKWPFQTDE